MIYKIPFGPTRLMRDFVKRVVRACAHSNILRPLWRVTFPVYRYALSTVRGVVLFYDFAHQRAVMDRIQRVKSEVDMLLSDNEAYQIHMAVTRTAKIPGAIAEVGVYQGGSAKLICETKGKRPLYLFDTFEGLKDVRPIDTLFTEGAFAADERTVRAYLRKYPNVHIRKGYFPASAGPATTKRFSFVHLDVDVYESTRASLAFFYPRMSRGGIILSHDYANAAGVRKAFDEFFRRKPETVLELSGTQCLVVKL
jgi:hypothetical protein